MGVFGWIIIGLLAGALAGFLVPGRERNGCVGTLLIGIAGGLIGGWLWTGPLKQSPATGFLGALLLAVLGAGLVLLVLHAANRRR
ncbi:MAG: GlsB/YeaQ/YmgE family stress response membrane protein [Chloroflexi bacterium]|nr:MAG: GlsB/YeaQ/YmgE family stress response membrane protein [Chloroflexota bacterium]